MTLETPCTLAGDTELLAGGDGEAGYRDGPGHDARFNRPTAACALSGGSGMLVVADSHNACIRLVDRGGNVSTLAGACGERPGCKDGPGSEALFGAGIRSLVCLDNCSVLVGDASNGRLRCDGQQAVALQGSGGEDGLHCTCLQGSHACERQQHAPTWLLNSRHHAASRAAGAWM